MRTICVMLLLCQSASAVSVFQVGNSLTWDSRPSYVDEMVTNLDLDVENGWHIRSASSLTDIWNDPIPSNPIDKTASPSPYPEALPGAWDKLIVQSYRGNGHTLAMDLQAVQNFADLAPDADLYIYGSWPQWFNWDNWLSPVSSDGSQLTVPQRNYFETLMGQLDRPSKLVPVGEVLYRIKLELEAGNLPFTSIQEFYRDDKHMGDWGKYFALVTTLTTTTGQNFGIGEYDVEALDADTRLAIQQLAWDVVANHPLTGVVTITGDYDGDGVVDQSDYDWWAGSFDKPVSFASDGNGDSAINLADYVVWRDQMSNVGEVVATAVPEPAGWFLLLVVGICVIGFFKL